MRILKLSDVYSPRVNGVSTSIQTFRQSLHELGHETLLLAPDYPGQEQRVDPGVRRTAARWSATALAGRMAQLYGDVAGFTVEALGEPVR